MGALLLVVIAWMIVTYFFGALGLPFLPSALLGIIGPVVLIACATAYTNKSDQKEAQRKRAFEEAQKKEQARKASQFKPTPPPPTPPKSHAGTMSQTKQPDPTGTLRQLKTMLDEGLISQEEYNSKKTEILGRM